jgi:excisionase family DNA binding protein
MQKLHAPVAGAETNGELLTARICAALLTRPELAARLKVTTRTLAEWDAQGKIPSIVIGRSVRYCWDDVLNWLRKTGVQR